MPISSLFQLAQVLGTASVSPHHYLDADQQTLAIPNGPLPDSVMVVSEDTGCGPGRKLRNQQNR